MALNLESKKSVVADVAEVAARAHSAVAAEYRGLTVDEMTALRSQARQHQVHLRVVKNTLARRAVENTAFACMQDGLTGPLVLAFSEQDPGAAARLMGGFAKDHAKLLIKLVAVGGQLLKPTDLERLAKLPTREQALSLFMAALKAPIEKLVRTMAEPHAKLARTVAALRDKKQASA